MHLAQHSFERPVALAPMAGITDAPFRKLCRRWGASYAVAEMLTSDASLWHTRKSRLRMRHDGEPGPRIVQIAGADPDMLAQAARLNVELGADVIDINMGCPAKKVCRRAAGSALLADEALVGSILEAVVSAVQVPVTLKFRTGPSREINNAVRIARMAEQAGITALALHGRSREDAYRGDAEHDTVRMVKQAVTIPVLANGDVTSPARAAEVLRHSGADGLLIGRGAQGQPWLFRRIRAWLDQHIDLPDPPLAERIDSMLEHISDIHAFYGAEAGLRIARKHIGWYLEQLQIRDGLPALEHRRLLMQLDDADLQYQCFADVLGRMQMRAAA